jgi:hypothetical protein
MATEPDRDPLIDAAIERLRDSAPQHDLWPAISSQLAPRQGYGTFVVRWPIALAAGLAIVAMSSAATMAFLRYRTVPAPAAAQIATVARSTDAAIPASYSPDDAALARAVADVERLVRSSLDRLDPAARLSVQQSLDALDRAIAQAAQREQAAPDDPRAAHYLTSALRKKLQVLRTVHDLTPRS